MNITASTSDHKLPHYRIVGGAETGGGNFQTQQIAVILLNRGGNLFHHQNIGRLLADNFTNIISVEIESGSTTSVESMLEKFPGVRFLFIQKDCSFGQQINIAINETAATYALVLWNDSLPVHLGDYRQFLKLLHHKQPLAIQPRLLDKQGAPLASIGFPFLKPKRRLQVICRPTAAEHLCYPSIYPFDYCAVYHCRKFIELGGYDNRINSSYWQKLDMAFRAFLWGEKILATPLFSIQYEKNPPREDSSINADYKRFYLKNLSVRINRDSGVIPLSGFFSYLASGGSLFVALGQFFAARRWVRANRFRFLTDAGSLIELWPIEEAEQSQR